MKNAKHVFTTGLLAVVTTIQPTGVSAVEENTQNRVHTMTHTSGFDGETEYILNPKVSLIDVSNTAQDLISQDDIRTGLIKLHTRKANQTVIFLLGVAPMKERAVKVDHYLLNGDSTQSYYLLKNNTLVPITYIQWTKYLY